MNAQDMLQPDRDGPPEGGRSGPLADRLLDQGRAGAAAVGTMFRIAAMRQPSAPRTSTIDVHIRRTAAPPAAAISYGPSAMATSDVRKRTDSTRMVRVP
jgi:hypothetical protein